MLISVLTGFAAGAVHVVSGADHMVAMAPQAMAKPKSALKDGLAWGVGHSAGVIILSLFGTTIKDETFLVQPLPSLERQQVSLPLLEQSL